MCRRGAAHPPLAPARGRGARGSGLFRPGHRGPGRVLRRQWRDARNAAAAGLAGAARPSSRRSSASRKRADRACGTARQQSVDIRGGHRVRRVRGGNRLARRSRWSRWWAWSGVAPLPSGLAVGTLDAFRSGARAVRWPAGGPGRALAARRGVGAAHHRRAHGPAHQPGRDGRGPVGHRTEGRARMEGMVADGRRIRVHLSGRDTYGRARPAIVGVVRSGGGRGARRAPFPRPA